jgi:valyl-tRNA synthetase
VPDSLRVLTPPLELAGRPARGCLVTLLGADDVVRRARSDGCQVTWDCGTLSGDLGSQYEVDRELARAGEDRSGLGADEFADRVRAGQAVTRTRVSELASALGIEVDLENGSLDRPATTLAARTAFVRLYEAGLLTRQEGVVDTCPRCLTAVAGPDVEFVANEAEAVVVRLHGAAGGVGLGGDSGVDVLTEAPELLAAAVAVVVPAGHPAEGLRVELPLAGRVVAVIADPSCDRPRLVVPAHDRHAADLSRRWGLDPVELLDVGGVVRLEGPLYGLSRYAARAKAEELLAAEGVIVDTVPVAEVSAQCRHCHTVLIPRVDRHWTLPVGPLEVAAADVVRDGGVSFTPLASREDFLAAAGQSGDWLVSRSVVAGQPVPAATCADCGSLAVTVEPLDDCPRCMGALQRDPGVLDARFAGAVWPLASAGWLAGAAVDPSGTSVVSEAGGIREWILPMAALGLWLAGAIPFSEVVVTGRPGVDADLDGLAIDDIEALIALEGPGLVRAALVAGADGRAAQ